MSWLSGRSRIAAILLGLAGAGALFAGLGRLTNNNPARLRVRAEKLAAEGNWAGSLEVWRAVNATSQATAMTYLGEAKACLSLGRAAQAERALRKAVAASSGETEAALLLLEILRVEDRPLDSFALGWSILDTAPPEAHPELLRELTLTALTDLPEDLARTTLERWIKADPDDVDAQVAYLRRVAAEPRAGDPDRESRLARMTALVEQNRDHLGALEALITALADAGEPERGKALLESWPTDQRDGRYWRLKGRWDLEYDGRPEEAVAAFEVALADFNQDWRTHYRLARALQKSGHAERAKREAEAVGRLRELLEPMTLAPRLDAAFARLDNPADLRTLADLCARAGLSRLADAWRNAGAHRKEPDAVPPLMPSSPPARSRSTGS